MRVRITVEEDDDIDLDEAQELVDMLRMQVFDAVDSVVGDRRNGLIVTVDDGQ